MINTIISHLVWYHSWSMISHFILWYHIKKLWYHRQNYDITIWHSHISHDIGGYITTVISYLWYHMWYHKWICDITTKTVISHDPRFQMYHAMVLYHLVLLCTGTYFLPQVRTRYVLFCLCTYQVRTFRKQYVLSTYWVQKAW